MELKGPMFAMMKVVGVSSEALGALHQVVGRDDLRTREVHNLKDSNQGDAHGRHPYVTIEDSKLDPKHQTYTVTLKVMLRFHFIRFNHPSEHHLYSPLRAIELVLKAIDPKLVPQDEVEEFIARKK